ncbi:MAG: peptide ABC transporter ATP-binding protein [Rhodospirillaceae bacterium]|jgi:peptide/nickel transport system ATP-binding protein|nr:peptide ABC transporter ATP-binding protein [Rhodospirillaceae bacterium]
MLSIKNLRVRYSTDFGEIEALSGLNLTCGKEILGVVGESGSGKSSLGKAIMGLLPKRATVAADQMCFDGHDLLNRNEKVANMLRGRQIAMIFQDPHLALNPIMKIGSQISETYRRHLGYGSHAARKYGLEMLDAVHIEDPSLMWNSYPRELSGGMAQRAMIAMMLACSPEFLIADEPTSALDVLSRQAVLQTLNELVKLRGMGLLFISHDLGLISRFCDRVVIIRDGIDVETVSANGLENSTHAYTKALLAARPRLVSMGSQNEQY